MSKTHRSLITFRLATTPIIFVNDKFQKKCIHSSFGTHGIGLFEHMQAYICSFHFRNICLHWMKHRKTFFGFDVLETFEYIEDNDIFW